MNDPAHHPLIVDMRDTTRAVCADKATIMAMPLA